MDQKISKDDSRLVLRTLETESYAAVVSAFRAQGHFDDYKILVLEHLRKALKIPFNRHTAEIRRALFNDLLTKVAQDLNPLSDVNFDWIQESNRNEQCFDDVLERNDEDFQNIADQLEELASKHNFSLDTDQRTIFEALKLKLPKDVETDVLTILEKHLSPMKVHESLITQPEIQPIVGRRVTKRRRRTMHNMPVRSTAVVQNKVPQIFSNVPINREQLLANTAGLNRPVVQYVHTPVSLQSKVPTFARSVSSSSTGLTKKSKKRSSLATSSIKNVVCPIEKTSNVLPFSVFLSPKEEQTIDFQLTSAKGGDVGSATIEKHSMMDVTSQNISAVGLTGITVKPTIKSPTIQQQNAATSVTLSPTKANLRTIFSSSYQQQTSRVGAPEMARNMANFSSTSQKVIVLPSPNVRRKVIANEQQTATTIAAETGDTSQATVEIPSSIESATSTTTSNVAEKHFATADSASTAFMSMGKPPTSYNTKGAGSDVIVVRRTATISESAPGTVNASQLESKPTVVSAVEPKSAVTPE